MIRTTATLLLLAATGCGDASKESPKTEHLEANLISEVSNINPGTPFWVGLRLEMEEGWHVNWKNPGDAGLAPTISWELPEGFSAGEIEWPIPERLVVTDFVLFGYEGTILLPVKITPPAAFDKKKVTLSAACDWVVCGEVCVPGEAKLSLSLPVKVGGENINIQTVKEFEATRSRTAQGNGNLKLLAATSADKIEIMVTPGTKNGQIIESLVFFPEKQGIINNAAEQKFSTKTSGYGLEIERDRMGQTLPDSLKGIIVLKFSDKTTGSEGINVSIPLEKSVSARN